MFHMNLKELNKEYLQWRNTGSQTRDSKITEDEIKVAELRKQEKNENSHRNKNEIWMSTCEKWYFWRKHKWHRWYMKSKQCRVEIDKEDYTHAQW